MKVKKNLSLEKMIVNKAELRALELGMNFSSYITMLINNDTNGIIIKREVIEPKKDNEYKLEEKVNAALDQF